MKKKPIYEGFKSRKASIQRTSSIKEVSIQYPLVSIQEQPEGFEIRYKDRVCIRHSRLHSAFSIGQGTAVYAMRHGSFTIKEGARTIERLTEWQLIEQSQENVRIRWGAQGNREVSFIADENGLHIKLSGFPAEYNRFTLVLESAGAEAIIGCGEQYSYLNLRGQRVPLWTEEQGVGRGPSAIKIAADVTMGAGGNRCTTYYPLPSFIAQSGWAFRAETRAYAVFDFRTYNRVVLEFWEQPRDMVILVEDHIEALVEKLSRYEGRQPQLPDWAFRGLILGAQGGTEEVLQKLDLLRAAGTPVVAIWAQDWEGRRITSFGKQLWWNWKVDERLYPGLQNTIQNLKREGIRFLGYINPFLAIEGSLYQEASKRGYCVKQQDGRDYLVTITTFPAAMLDLSNPEAVTWIQDVIRRNMIGIGLSGWMADFGEYLPTDSVLHSGDSAEKYHSEYPTAWARVHQEVAYTTDAGTIQNTGEKGILEPKELLYFTRSGHCGTSRFTPLVWAGDQLVNWNRDDGLASIIPAALSLGVCGIGQWHADIGGYTTVGWIRRSKELLLRWIELAALTPVMRTHEGNRPEANAQVWSDPEIIQHTSRMSRFHAALAPYFMYCAQEYQSRGLPILRALCLAYPDDTISWNLPYQFLIGSDLLAAPVIRRGRRSWKVYIPRDRWVHLWSCEVYEQGWHRIAAPIGRIPVFYRQGSPWEQLFTTAKGVFDHDV
ncbi:MAG: alpha-glucosidase [Termitinemataceae bacterium]